MRNKESKDVQTAVAEDTKVPSDGDGKSSPMMVEICCRWRCDVSLRTRWSRREWSSLNGLNLSKYLFDEPVVLARMMLLPTSTLPESSR